MSNQLYVKISYNSWLNWAQLWDKFAWLELGMLLWWWWGPLTPPRVRLGSGLILGFRFLGTLSDRLWGPLFFWKLEIKRLTNFASLISQFFYLWHSRVDIGYFFLPFSDIFFLMFCKRIFRERVASDRKKTFQNVLVVAIWKMKVIDAGKDFSVNLVKLSWNVFRVMETHRGLDQNF